MSFGNRVNPIVGIDLIPIEPGMVYRLGEGEAIQLVPDDSVTVEIEHDAKILGYFDWWAVPDREGRVADICGVEKIPGTTRRVEVRWPTIFIRVTGPRHIMELHFDLHPSLEVA